MRYYGILKILWYTQDKALQYYTKSLNLNISFYGQKHLNIAEIYNNIGVIYKNNGKYQQSLTYYDMSVNMNKEFFGQNHPSIANTYNNIAIVYSLNKNPQKQFQFSTMSNNMYIDLYNQQHPSLADAYATRGSIYKDMGRYEEAMMCYNKSLNITLQFKGQVHPYVADTYFNIAMTYFLVRKVKQALKYCRKYNKTIQLLSIKQWKSNTNFYQLLSRISLAKNKSFQSLHYAYFALDNFLKFNPLDHPQSQILLINFAQNYFNKKRYIQSYFFYRLTCQMLLKYFTIYHKNLLNAKQKMNWIEQTMPSLIHKYTLNIQFMNEISYKYNQLPEHKLMKLLMSKKWQLKFEQHYRSNRNKDQYLKCAIEIYLCYKYLGYRRQMNKSEETIKEELLRMGQLYRSMFGKFIQEIL